LAPGGWLDDIAVGSARRGKHPGLRPSRRKDVEELIGALVQFQLRNLISIKRGDSQTYNAL
jgi:hypothetical protein